MNESRRHTGEKLSEAKAVAIKVRLDAGDSIKEIAREEKVSKNCVRAIDRGITMPDPEKVDAVKKALVGKYYNMADLALDNITPEKLKASSAAQLVMVSGTALDKARLIDGLPTANLALRSAPDAELEAEMQRLQEQLDGWESGRIQDAEVVSRGDSVSEGAGG